MDSSIEAELRVRRRVEAILNKTVDEFPDKLSHNDYLELRETYISNLFYNENVAETEAKLAEYQRVNQASIAMNRAKQAGVQGGGDAQAVLVQSTLRDAAADAPSAGGLVYAPTTSALPATAARPVPMHADFTQDAEGRFMLKSNRVRKVSWRDVAKASGWDPQAVLRKTLRDSAPFWL